MKITKTRLKEIIREELAREGKRTRMSMPALSDDDYHQGKRTRMSMPALSDDDFEPDLPKWEGEPFGEYDLDAENEKGGLGDLQSDEKFTGGSPEERLLTLMRAREVLAAMSKEKLTALSKSLDAEQVAVLRHILANPMYAAQAKSDDAAWEKEVGPGGNEMELEEGITPGVQQLMKHYPHAAAKIKKLAGNGYRANEIKRMLNLGYRG